ncbi:MAG: hypothetical protein D6812_09870 [Deltaproteobacteria bacterium]|nr:MAG: hypothetical protein D6812_09870 [Deltaproteobacteria bacterium]
MRHIDVYGPQGFAFTVWTVKAYLDALRQEGVENPTLEGEPVDGIYVVAGTEDVVVYNRRVPLSRVAELVLRSKGADPTEYTAV